LKRKKRGRRRVALDDEKKRGWVPIKKREQKEGSGFVLARASMVGRNKRGAGGKRGNGGMAVVRERKGEAYHFFKRRKRKEVQEKKIYRFLETRKKKRRSFIVIAPGARGRGGRKRRVREKGAPIPKKREGTTLCGKRKGAG